MKDRVGQMVGQVVEGMPWLGTFHSIGVKILRRHAELVGLKSNFTILDVDDQIRVIKQLLEAEKLDEKRWPARVFASILDGWKNRGLTPDQVPGRRGRGLRQRQGQEALRRLSGAAEDAQRRRLRRPAAGDTSGCSAASRTCCASTSSASNTFWSTNIRTPTWRSICGCGCWRSRRRAGATGGLISETPRCARRLRMRGDLALRDALGDGRPGDADPCIRRKLAAPSRSDSRPSVQRRDSAKKHLLRRR